MIVTASLVWWDERPEDLARCVRGVATVADRIVAVDGAYRRYPGATVRSDSAQEQAILETAAEAGIEAIVHIPTELWAGQLAKRTFALQEAAKDSDWIAVVDTDWVVSGDRDAIRVELETTQYDVLRALLVTPASTEGPIATGWHQKQLGASYYHPHLIRSYPGYKVGPRHGWYSALRKKNRRVWVCRGHQSVGVRPHTNVASNYRIDHMFTERSEEQILANRAFCNDRSMVVRRTHQEDDMPGLPRPVFDFETIPYQPAKAPKRNVSTIRTVVRSVHRTEHRGAA